MGIETTSPGEREEESTLVFRLEGLDCADCAFRVEEIVRSLDGVRKAQVNFGAATLKVEGDSSVIPLVLRRVEEAGYHAYLEESHRPSAIKERASPFWGRHRSILPTAFSGLALALAFTFSALGVAEPLPILLFASAILLGGYRVARKGWVTLRATKSLDIDALMTLAAIGAMAVGEWAEAATAMFLFSLGNLLESYTLERSRQAIRHLMQLAPQEATRIHGGLEEQVPVTALRVGDRIIIRPGGRIPMDGRVLNGRSAVNQAPLTGESIPADKAPGDEVYAGTINGQGALEVEITKTAGEDTLSKLIRLVGEAQAQKAQAQQFVEVFARYYTPLVIIGALGLAAIPPLFFNAPFTNWFYRALVLLVIACPCALVISTPVSIVSAISSAARQGVLIKGGAYLEAMGLLKAMAFDKTGTMTYGQPAVTDILSFNDISPDEVLALAASLEVRSEHPLAQAVVRAARERGLDFSPASELQALPGRGARGVLGRRTLLIGSHTFFEEELPHRLEICQRLENLEEEGKTAMLLGCEEGECEGRTPEVVGLIAVADKVREKARLTVAALRRAGIEHTVFLTGDNARTAQAIAAQIGVDEVRSNLLPEDKVASVEELLASYGLVAMVGDGLNDAPALARATVGIAMGAAGNATVLETADVALMADDLSRLPYVIGLGRRARSIIRQNIAFSLSVKALFIALALFGLATLWMAVMADVGASLLVILNGMRLLK